MGRRVSKEIREEIESDNQIIKEAENIPVVQKEESKKEPKKEAVDK